LKTIERSDKELQEVIDRDESHFFDIKEHAASGKAVQKVAASFANADGGELIVGIKDKKRGTTLAERWDGVTNIEQLNGHLQALFEIKPAIDMSHEFIKRKEGRGYALRVLIEKGAQVCATADGTIYVRLGAQSLPVKDAERIQQLNFAKGASSYEDSVLPELPPEQVVDAKELSGYLQD
jgi:ATP-dependent DNA helicase RecG